MTGLCSAECECLTQIIHGFAALKHVIRRAEEKPTVQNCGVVFLDVAAIPAATGVATLPPDGALNLQRNAQVGRGPRIVEAPAPGWRQLACEVVLGDRQRQSRLTEQGDQDGRIARRAAQPGQAR